MLRLIALSVAVFAVFLVSAAAVAVLAEALGLTEHLAAGIGWAVGAVAAVAASRFWRAARRKRAAVRVARDRAKGAELQREDRRRYEQVLENAADTLALTDPDLYVGQRLAASVPTRAAGGKRRFRWRRAPAWQPPTTGQDETIEKLTEELERATLVRSLGDGSAEVVGSTEIH